jgi:glycosyltransferase involved in cell wall biosynthesis
VCYVGRFDLIKGSDLLVQIFAHVLDRVAGSRFEIAGGIPDNGKAERRWIRRWRRDAPAALQQRTRLLGWRSADEVAELYGRSAVLVVPSRYETFGQVVLEEMLHGCAVTASACGGVSELVEHDETGVLSTAGDAIAMADGIAALLQDPGRARRIASRAAAAARARHLWDDVIEGYITLYRGAR